MRVTIDLDNPSQLKLLKTALTMNYYIGIDEIRISSSGEGYHLIKRGLPISFKDSLRIRAALGECPGRLYWDEMCDMKPKQILWMRKRGYKGGRAEKIDLKNILSLPWKSRLPRLFFVRKFRNAK